MIKHINELRKLGPRKDLKFRVLSHEEAAQVRAAQRPRPVTPRTSSAEYTRILLDAKEGKVAPGEADRRIVQKGGLVRVQPLPKPPR